MKPSQTVTFWRDADVRGLEIGLMDRSTHVFPRHSHEFYAIGCVERGASKCLGTMRSAAVVEPGWLALINPGVVHTGGPTGCEHITYRMFYLSPEWVRRAAADLTERDAGCPEFTRIAVSDARAWAVMRYLARTLPGRRSLLRRQSALVASFARLLREHGEQRPAVRRVGDEPRAVAAARDRLAAELDDKLSLDELAAEAGLSRYHLLRVFKKATGLTPHAFRTQLRIERAKALLRGGAGIAETACACGFADQAHFANRFRQYTGATPGQYRMARPG